MISFANFHIADSGNMLCVSPWSSGVNKPSEFIAPGLNAHVCDMPTHWHLLPVKPRAVAPPPIAHSTTTTTTTTHTSTPTPSPDHSRRSLGVLCFCLCRAGTSWQCSIMSRVRATKQITGAHTASPAGISKCTLSNAIKSCWTCRNINLTFYCNERGPRDEGCNPKEHKKHEIKRITHEYLTGLLKNLSSIWPQRHRSTITDIQTAVEDAAATGRCSCRKLLECRKFRKISLVIRLPNLVAGLVNLICGQLQKQQDQAPASGFSWGLRCRCWARHSND